MQNSSDEAKDVTARESQDAIPAPVPQESRPAQAAQETPPAQDPPKPVPAEGPWEEAPLRAAEDVPEEEAIEGESARTEEEKEEEEEEEEETKEEEEAEEAAAEETLPAEAPQEPTPGQPPTEAETPQPPAEVQEPTQAEAAATVEAVLFAADAPLQAAKVAQVAQLPAKAVREAIAALNERYQQIGAAFRIEEIAGGLQMLTLPKYGDVLERLYSARSDSRLSQAAMETLAVIAYRQPVLRADIEAIRGVACGEVLRGLMEKQLIRIDGRAQILGRPLLYGTTRRFLELFGLASLEDLPKAEELRMPAQKPAGETAAGAGATAPATEMAPIAAGETAPAGAAPAAPEPGAALVQVPAAEPSEPPPPEADRDTRPQETDTGAQLPANAPLAEPPAAPEPSEGPADAEQAVQQTPKESE
jgi:segregation and condensation protein B